MTDFADSNILIYAVIEGNPRCEAARDALRTGPATSVQALNEFVWAGRRKFRLDADDPRLPLPRDRLLTNFHLPRSTAWNLAD